MTSLLQRLAQELTTISRDLKAYGLYFHEDDHKFLTALHDQVGLTPESERAMKDWREYDDTTFETVRGDKVWVDKKDVVKMEYGQGEYDEYRINVDPAHGARFKTELGEDKLNRFFGLK